MRQFICTFTAILLMTCLVSAAYDINDRVSDGAELLTAEQSDKLKSLINNIIDKYEFDAVIVTVTVNNLGDEAPSSYADDYFDDNGFGYGNNRDGILFLFSSEDGYWYISTSGKGTQIINDAAIYEINNKVVSYLRNKDYYNAFALALNMTEDYLENPPETYSSNGLGKIPVVWIAAFVIALISVLVMKAQLKTARPRPLANDYVVRGSFNLTHKRDMFINTHTTKTPRPKDTPSSGGGGSVHTGSSGRSHGGGGMKI